MLLLLISKLAMYILYESVCFVSYQSQTVAKTCLLLSVNIYVSPKMLVVPSEWWCEH